MLLLAAAQCKPRLEEDPSTPHQPRSEREEAPSRFDPLKLQSQVQSKSTYRHIEY